MIYIHAELYSMLYHNTRLGFEVVKAKWGILSEEKEKQKKEEGRKERREEGREKKRDLREKRESNPPIWLVCNRRRGTYNAYLNREWIIEVVIRNHRTQIYKYLIKY